MARIKVRQNIEIERNVIERFLMNVREFIKGNRKVVLYTIIGVFAMVVVVIGVLVYYQEVAESERVALEDVISKYREVPAEEESEVIDDVIKGLTDLSKSAMTSYVTEMSLYYKGNLLFEKGQYEEAMKTFRAFGEESSSDIFAPLGLLKGAIAAEEAGKVDEAKKIYEKLEGDYSESIIADQIYYNMGRIYSEEDPAKAKKYFNKVISSHPFSDMAKKAKERLFFLGTNKEGK